MVPFVSREMLLETTFGVVFPIFFKGISMTLSIKGNAFIWLLAGNVLLPVCEATAEGNSWIQGPVGLPL